jgi:glucose-1-phosphate thymidylyltransferase
MANEGPRLYLNVVGLVPAAGQATRIAPLPCSKELYPLGFRPVDEGRSLRPKVACHYLFEKMRLAGVAKAYIVLGEGKWDIPAYLGDGTILNMHLAYLIIRSSSGVPYTLDQAYPFVQDALVAFGFPDIIFQCEEAFVKLLTRQISSKPDVVLGVFPTSQPHKWDMVELDDHGRIRSIEIKPQQTLLRYSWSIAVWTPVFSRFMHEYLASIRIDNKHDNLSQGRELIVGDVIKAAIDHDLRVEGVTFPNDTCLDIGTPDDLLHAMRTMVQPHSPAPPFP